MAKRIPSKWRMVLKSEEVSMKDWGKVADFLRKNKIRFHENQVL